MKKNKLITLINPIIFLALAICIIIYPENAFKSSLAGLNLWYNSVCPALLPFFICVDILISLGVISFFGQVFQPLMSYLFNIPGEGAFAFIMSISSGYPVGAKIVSHLRKSRSCTKVEGQRMISLCSTSGPLFIIGAVSIGILKNPYIASALLCSHYLSAITIGLLMRFYKYNEKSNKEFYRNPFNSLFEHLKNNKKPLGQIFAESIINSVNLILMVGGYIIIFSVFTDIIRQTKILNLLADSIVIIFPKTYINSNTFTAFFTGFLEVTNGVKASAILDISWVAKAALVSFFIGFGGLSVNAQVSGLIHDTDIDFKLYLIVKIVQGIIASIYSALLLKFSVFTPAFSNLLKSIYANPLQVIILKAAINLFFMSFVFLVILTLLILLYRQKNKKV